MGEIKDALIASNTPTGQETVKPAGLDCVLLPVPSTSREYTAVNTFLSPTVTVS
ncbi:13452_t:CDS:2 [Ambispora gerdemannii]|uniref:13452_t:CDS:1 n=1 Tax=Ambispora gerdemannii TaxID=144530 RepID=A0A9N8YVM5_9GLOM|nr:13452_t:CDS:2 [Ambispora gerdemannii]